MTSWLPHNYYYYSYYSFWCYSYSGFLHSLSSSLLTFFTSISSSTHWGFSIQHSCFLPALPCPSCQNHSFYCLPLPLPYPQYSRPGSAGHTWCCLVPSSTSSYLFLHSGLPFGLFIAKILGYIIPHFPP